jgi:glycosyltransferase Alg8
MLSFLGIMLSVPTGVVQVSGGLILTLGFVGLWRYSWALVNYSRALYYVHSAYPRRKAEAERLYGLRQRPAHAFLLTTSYKVETATTTRVYRSVFQAAARSAGGATVVASVVDAADERLVRSVFARFEGSHVKLIVDRIAGTGKRDALATSLQTISQQYPTADDIVLLIDGDTCVPADIVGRSAPFFTRRSVGALTTDERSEVAEASLFRDWFALRFTQRQMMMSAMALSWRVLTLTGRLSIFRADLATHPEFISSIKSDYIDHWRLGRVKFLTGDDKSTWFWLLKNGYEMAYLPDVQSDSMETQPRPGFVDSAITLMVRWFGNMLRTNGRALRLSPTMIGFFTWWSILDQRISMWTTLTGPIGAILFSLFVDPMVLPAYLAWVMATRYATCCLISVFRGPFPITYPFLLYFGQITGALVKSYVLFRLDRQRWTRQSTASELSAGIVGQVRAGSSTYLHLLALGWLVVGILTITGFGPLPLK